MTTLQNTLTTGINRDGGHSLVKRALVRLSAFSEIFWFCLTFLLFLVMGPFSAIAVLFGLGSLAKEAKHGNLIEPASV